MKPTDLLGFSEVFQKGKPISSLWQPDNNEDSIPYLLNAAVSEFSKEDAQAIYPRFEDAMNALSMMLDGNIDGAMGKYNG